MCFQIHYLISDLYSNQSPTTHTITESLFIKHYNAILEKEMATHSSVPAQRIPGMVEPGGLPSMGSNRVGHN